MMLSSSGLSRVLIEVCVDSLESAIIAQENGANRLEVCANLPVGGGTTPSMGLVGCILESVKLPVMVLIRCRTGDFVYSPSELVVMLADVKLLACSAKQHSGREGEVGVVIGALTKEGRVDEPAVKALLQAAGTMPVTFHRAFDMVRDADEALQTIANLGGIKRILTSGLAPTSLAGLPLISSLSSSPQLNNNNLTILPGSGISSRTILPLISALYPVWQAQGKRGEVHLSAGAWEIPKEGVWRREGMGFGLGVTVMAAAREGRKEKESEERENREWGRWMVRGDELRKVRGMVDVFVAEQERAQQ